MTRVESVSIPRYIPKPEDQEDAHRNNGLHQLEVLEAFTESGGYRPNDVRAYNSTLAQLGFTKS